MPNQSGKWRAQVKRLDISRPDAYAPRTGQWLAKTGDLNGIVDVPNRPGYIYVRDGDGNLMQVFNQHVPDVADQWVVIGYEQPEPKLLQVLSLWTTFADQPIMRIPSHAPTHVWPGYDTVDVQSQQIVPALVRAKSALTIAIFPFICPIGARQYTSVIYQEIDLTSHVPSTGARLVLVSVHTDGTIVLVDGAIVASPEILSAADIPTVADQNDTGIAAVRLYSGQTDIIENATYTDIFDLRWLSQNGAPDPVTEDHISLSDVTTDNVSTSKHGFAPKLTGNDDDYLNGAGGYSKPPGLHAHGLMRWDGASGDTTFDLPDIAEHVDEVFQDGAALDPVVDYSLSSDGTQVVLSAALGAPAIMIANYVLAVI